MDEDKLLDNVLKYMKDWLMLQCDEDEITILPAVGRMTGFYPEDFVGGTKA